MIKKLEEYKIKKIYMKILTEEDTDQYTANINKLKRDIEEVESFINSQDAYIKKILIERYIKGNTWQEVAYKVIGYKGKADTVRTYIKRYLNKHGKEKRI